MRTYLEPQENLTDMEIDMKYTFNLKTPVGKSFVGYGEDALDALRQLFGIVTDQILDTICDWKESK